MIIIVGDIVKKTDEKETKMRKLKMMFLTAAVTGMLLGSNYASAQTDPTLKEWIQTRFDEIDNDKDGKLSYDEFMANWESDFKLMDANSDGFLAKEEIGEVSRERRKTWREKRRERRSKKQ
jgi:Ca2+-binding EF-hand superfamily protein